jgi:hypothetical protein
LTASMAVILAVTAAAATAAAVGIELGHVGCTAASGGVTAWNIVHNSQNLWIIEHKIIIIILILTLQVFKILSLIVSCINGINGLSSNNITQSVTVI